MSRILFNIIIGNKFVTFSSVINNFKISRYVSFLSISELFNFIIFFGSISTGQGFIIGVNAKCIAFWLFSFVLFTSALFSINHLTTSGNCNLIAKCNGVSYFLLKIFTPKFSGGAINCSNKAIFWSSFI